MSRGLSALDDPECPDCGTSLTTERAGQRRGGTWWCRRCGETFTPRDDHGNWTTY